MELTVGSIIAYSVIITAVFTFIMCSVHYGFQIKILEARLALRDYVDEEDDDDYFEPIEPNYSRKNHKEIVREILKRSRVI